jgi:hypothetical protein
MAMIKRDSKPTNPETAILIKLFEKFNEDKSKEMYFEHVQAYIKARMKQIREESAERGVLLP